MTSETLVLVPGLLCDATVWRHQIEAFGARRRVLVPELSRFDSIPAMAEALLAQSPDRFALAGHSLGGRIAFEAYRQAPERIERLALLDTGVHPRTESEASARYALLAIAFERGMRAVAEAWLPPMVHPMRLGDRNFLAPLEAMVERYTPERFRNQITALLSRPDASDVLERIACPTLVLCGREDGWAPLAQHERFTGGIAGARLAVIEECGHMAPYEQPATVTAEFSTWLRA